MLQKDCPGINIAAYMDNTNLKADASRQDMRTICSEAMELGMAAVCVNPWHVPAAVAMLSNSPVRVCTVISFPLGAEPARCKAAAARFVLEEGAGELDMVMNIGAFKEGSIATVEKEINLVLKLKKDFNFILKVIVETALLDKQELAVVTRLVGDSGADYIKTSTGFSSRGASLEDIAVIKANRNGHLKIKASGGIREMDQALQFIAAGVDRIGSSSAAAIVRCYHNRGGQ